MAVLAPQSYRQAMVTVRRNDARPPREGARMTSAERRRLQHLRRGRDTLIRALLERGVPVWQLAEALR